MRKSLPALLAGTLIAQTIVLTIANDLPISGTNSIFLGSLVGFVMTAAALAISIYG